MAPLPDLTELDSDRLLGEYSAPAPLSTMTGPELLVAVEQSGLTGRGGAAFPSHVKMRGVLAGPRPRVMVANGAEGEPASDKDKTLLEANPHLVLDGLQLAARIIEADRVFVYVHDDPRVVAAVTYALAERRHAGHDHYSVELETAPRLFVAGEESAVVSRISGGAARPRSKPPRVFEAGAFGRPTLVQNVETLAHLANIARGVEPETMLFTVSGAVRRPGVIEAPIGVSMTSLVESAGGLTTLPQAVLLGGYHGAWVSWSAARDLVMSNDALKPLGLSVGAGVVVVLPAEVCGPTEVSRVLRYLADQSAGQCGPCVFGLPALATSYERATVNGRAGHRRRLAELSGMLEKRGGCNHPDGTLRFLRSAHQVFAGHLDTHRNGVCPLPPRVAVLPIPPMG